MKDGVRQELDRLFSGIENNPAGFAFWVGIHDYVHFVQSTEQTKQILEDDQKVSMEKCAVIRSVWQSERAQYDGKDCETGHKVSKADLERIKKLHSGELSKIESLSLYYNFLDLEMIYFAVNEMANKHSLYTRNFQHQCDEDGQRAWQEEMIDGAVRFEKELNEIRKGEISKSNELIFDAETYWKALKFVHGQLINALSIKPIVEKQSQIETLPNEEHTPATFDEDASVLRVWGHAIQIKRRAGTNNGHQVLVEIFKAPQEEHDYAFLYEDMFGDEYKSNKNNWTKCHSACKEIDKKIKEATEYTIKDFLIYTTGIAGSVKINEKYLEK